MEKYICFYKREEGKLSIKLYSEAKFKTVAGLAGHNASVEGYTQFSGVIQSVDEVSALGYVMRVIGKVRA